jgi:hypothetical protein
VSKDVASRRTRILCAEDPRGGKLAPPCTGSSPRRRVQDVVEAAARWSVPDAAAYSYLLGSYLGDGHLAHKPPRTWTLRVSCDGAYPGIKREVRNAMETTFPGHTSRERRYAKGDADIVAITHPALGRAFPQHGPGRKHEREIALTDWQLAITRSHPGELVRGLVHSDGCRVINRFSTRLPSGRVAEYEYVRYFFSNLSEDIRQIFWAHCSLLGIRVTQPNHRNLAVSHRDSVAIMERIVGAKT